MSPALALVLRCAALLVLRCAADIAVGTSGTAVDGAGAESAEGAEDAGSGTEDAGSGAGSGFGSGAAELKSPVFGVAGGAARRGGAARTGATAGEELFSAGEELFLLGRSNSFSTRGVIPPFRVRITLFPGRGARIDPFLSSRFLFFPGGIGGDLSLPPSFPDVPPGDVNTFPPGDAAIFPPADVTFPPGLSTRKFL